MLKIDRLAGRVSVTPILSWREAHFVAAYDKGATGPSRAALANRTRARRLHHAAPVSLEREFIEENKFSVIFHPFDWRLNDLTGGAPKQ